LAEAWVFFDVGLHDMIKDKLEAAYRQNSFFIIVLLLQKQDFMPDPKAAS
jgi:hypothetical protein